MVDFCFDCLFLPAVGFFFLFDLPFELVGVASVESLSTAARDSDFLCFNEALVFAPRLGFFKERIWSLRERVSFDTAALMSSLIVSSVGRDDSSSIAAAAVVDSVLVAFVIAAI